MNTHPTKKTLIMTGLIGLAAAFLVGTGEFLLQFSADGGYADPGYGWLANIPMISLQKGHFLAVLAAPFYLVGYWHLMQMLRPGGKWSARVFGMLGGYSFMVGAVWIGQRAFLAMVAHEIAGGQPLEELLHTMAGFNEPLVNVLRVAMVVISLIWIVQIGRGGTRYPRIMALFSPFVLLASVFAIQAFVPGLGNLIVPTAMNTAHFVLFLLSTLVAISLPSQSVEPE